MILQRSILQQNFPFFYHFDFIIALFKTNLIASVACMLLLFMFDWLFMQLKCVSKRLTTKWVVDFYQYFYFRHMVYWFEDNSCP